MKIVRCLPLLLVVPLLAGCGGALFGLFGLPDTATYMAISTSTVQTATPIYSPSFPMKMGPMKWHRMCLDSKKMLRAHPHGPGAYLWKVREQVACHHRR